MLLGMAALMFLAFTVPVEDQTIQRARTFRAAPACPDLTTGPSCVGGIIVYVTGVDGDSVYLSGSTPELGWVDLDKPGARALAGRVHYTDEVTADIWHQQAVSITADGRTGRTTDYPTAPDLSVLGAIVTLQLAAFVLLHWNRSRPWLALSARPRRRLWMFEGAVVIVVATSDVMLVYNSLWGDLVMVAGAALLLYGSFARDLHPRALIWLAATESRRRAGWTPPIR
jgi:hypothetical protein